MLSLNVYYAVNDACGIKVLTRDAISGEFIDSTVFEVDAETSIAFDQDISNTKIVQIGNFWGYPIDAIFAILDHHVRS